MADADKHWDLTSDPAEAAAPTIPASTSAGYSPGPYYQPAYQVSESYVSKAQEETRGDLARGLLWLLTFAIGGVLVFVGLGRLDGSVITQSIFPSLIALAGTALGFYFGSQTGKADSSTSANTQPLSFTPAVSSSTSSTSNPAAGGNSADDQGKNS